MVIFSWIRFIYCLNQRRAWRDARGESKQEHQKTEIRKMKAKEIKKERSKKKTKKRNFIINIEESVREPQVPILSGVQPRRRFFHGCSSRVYAYTKRLMHISLYFGFFQD